LGVKGWGQCIWCTSHVMSVLIIICNVGRLLFYECPMKPALLILRAAITYCAAVCCFCHYRSPSSENQKTLHSQNIMGQRLPGLLISWLHWTQLLQQAHPLLAQNQRLMRRWVRWAFMHDRCLAAWDSADCSRTWLCMCLAVLIWFCE
jgi:hypothetical protein